MDEPKNKLLAFKIPTDGSSATLINYLIKKREEHDGGHGEFFDEILDLKSWYGSAFLKRRFSDFYIDEF